MFTRQNQKKQGMGNPPYPVLEKDKRSWLAAKNVVSYRYFTWILLLALLLVGVACNPTTPPAGEAPQATPAEPTQPAEATEETTAFPVTITHKYGETTLSKAPERVVVIGYNEQDIYFALGVKPVAVRYWYGDAPHAIFPWATDEAAGAEPEVLEMPFGELNLEAIVNLKPDLISGIYSGITQEEYEQLSLIAPTIAQSADYIEFGIPWQYATQTIGSVLGKAEEAANRIAEVEAQFAEVQANNPAFVGKTLAVAYANGDGTYGFYTDQDARARFFTNLGFEIPAELKEIAGESFYANLSQEKLNLLDQDVILFLGLQFLEGGRETIQNDPLINQLAAMKEGRVVYVPLEVDDALQFGSVLSLEYALEGIVPELQAAVGGAKTTTATSTHTVTDAAGREVEIPTNPARIVTLTEIDLDSALALGITPVGSVNGRGQETLPSYLLHLTENVQSVGTIAEPNLETILTLKPDLILVSSPIPAVEELLPQLEQIAPVVVPAVAGSSWQETLNGVAAVLNRTTEAETFLADYNNQVANLTKMLPADIKEVSVVRWNPDGPVVMLPNSFSSQVLADVGLTRPTAQAELAGSHPVHSDVISMETMGVINADLIFAGGLNPDGVTALEEMLANPLVQALPAVQAGRLVVVDGLVWGSVGGPLAALHVLADVEKGLGDGEPAGETTTFPVTIEHKFGSTTIPAVPQRVITIGYSEQDAVLALGVVPIAIRDWFGEQPYGVWPWGQPLLGEATPELLQMPYGELNYELITSLKPDLLVATHSGITVEEYALLAQIAPTLAQPDEYPDFGVPWQVQTELIGRALGKETQAKQLVAEVEAQLEEAQTTHGSFGGATVAWVTPAADAGQFWVVGEKTPPLRFLTGLGLTYDPALSEVVGDLDSAQISSEQISLLDVDVLIIRVPTAEEQLALQNDPLFSQLKVMQEGRVIFFIGSDPLYGALSFSTVLSLPYALEGLVTQIEAAVK